MRREYVKWASGALGREMEMLVFGHGGTPVLVLPTSMGRFFEWEDFGMVAALGHQLESGLNRLYCVDSIDKETFYAHDRPGDERMRRHAAYERYLLEEVLGFIAAGSGSQFVIVAGASFGAYHAANLTFRHPWTFGKLVAMGGAYDIKSFMDGYYDDDVYFNNPPDYLANLTDPHWLAALRRVDIRLAAGETDFCRTSTAALAETLGRKSVPAVLDVWGDGAGHDWPWWRGMIAKHIA